MTNENLNQIIMHSTLIAFDLEITPLEIILIEEKISINLIKLNFIYHQQKVFLYLPIFVISLLKKNQSFLIAKVHPLYSHPKKKKNN